MQLRKGNMWDVPADVMLFTGNATVRSDGALVMGRGAAKEAQFKFPNCNRAFGSLVTHHRRTNPPGTPYSILIHPDRHSPILAAFQVKWGYSMSAKLDLIAGSSERLRRLALDDWREKSISMNFPGIGWGCLHRQSVLPIIECLPDNVTVWEYPGNQI